jgi:plasmid stabilization system protein ParE
MTCQVTATGGTRCLRAEGHVERHRFTPTKQSLREEAAADRAARLAHLASTNSVKIGRFTVKSGGPVRLDRSLERVKAEWRGWHGAFQRVVTNTRTGKTYAEVVGGKNGKDRRLSAVPVEALIYVRPKRSAVRTGTSDKEATT